MRYRLPEVLGGGEYEGRPGALLMADHIALNIPGAGGKAASVYVYRGFLTEIEEPLPEEPPPLAVVLDKDGKAWQHTGGYRGPWECTHDDGGEDWGDLNRDYGPLTRLVPDPSAEPVELPWSKHLHESVVNVVTGDFGEVLVETISGGRAMLLPLNPPEARDMARALMTAADAAEKEQS